MRAVATLTLIGAMSAGAHAGITAGQIDDFQDGTIQGWHNPVDGTFENLGGGILGAGDRYLHVRTNGNPQGPGSTPAVFNLEQWTGDYLSAGITSITMDIANFTSPTLPESDLNLRLVIFADGGSIFTTTATVDLSADGIWRSVTFDVSEAGVTMVDGGFSYAETMDNVTRLLIRHQDGEPTGIGGTPAFPGAEYGLDNIRAVPAPGALALLAMTGLAGARRRRAALAG